MAGKSINLQPGTGLQLTAFPPTGAPRPVLPFLLGALIGGVAGTVLGSLVAGLLGEAISGLFRSVSRKVNPNDQPPFDLLLQ